jgi:hypothetical protein
MYLRLTGLAPMRFIVGIVSIIFYFNLLRCNVQSDGVDIFYNISFDFVVLLLIKIIYFTRMFAGKSDEYLHLWII